MPASGAAPPRCACCATSISTLRPARSSRSRPPRPRARPRCSCARRECCAPIADRSRGSAAPARRNGAPPDGIAYASDRPFPYGFLSIREALEYAAIVRDLPLRDSSVRVTRALERTGLAAFADRRVDSLDGAQLSRFGLAAALLACPRLILVDDLASGCDADTAHELVALLRLAAADGAGVVAAGKLVPWLASADDASPCVPTRPVSLVAGRIEIGTVEPLGAPRRVPVTGLAARVAEHRSQSTAHQNGAR